MRCYECGHINKSDAKICVKCGTKLSSAQQQPSPPGNAAGGNRTIVGKASEAPAWDDKPGGQPQTVGQKSQKRQSVPECSACGYYPLREFPSKSHPCVNCGFTGYTTGKSDVSANSPSGQANSHSSKTIKVGAVNLGKEHPKPKVVLHDENTGKKILFEGEQIVLNRGSLDPDNPSISSKEHATIYLENGKILIEDKSSNQATFIQATGKTEIPANSLIIVGNKVYKVEVEK